MWNPHRNEGKGGYQPDVENIMLCIAYQSLVGTDAKMSHDYIGEGFVFEQFTGLLDMNGNEIFQGDVNEDGGVVIWNESDASFCWEYVNVEVMSMGDESTWCRITGNIHTP